MRSISPVELLVARAGKLDEPGRMCREVASIVACLLVCLHIACFLLYLLPSTVLRTNVPILYLINYLQKLLLLPAENISSVRIYAFIENGFFAYRHRIGIKIRYRQHIGNI